MRDTQTPIAGTPTPKRSKPPGPLLPSKVLLNNLLCAALSLLLVGCAGTERGSVAVNPSSTAAEFQGYMAIDDYFVVDCMLPGQIRRFGQMSQITKPRPARLQAFLCRVRGGTYVDYDRASIQTSVAVWETLANSGDVEAQLTLGRLYERGGGSMPQYEQAAHWYQQAMAGGSNAGKLALASLYERGKGVPVDMEKALVLYREALGLSETEELVRRNIVDARETELENQLDAARQQIESLESQKAELELRVSKLRAKESALNQESARLRQLIAKKEKEQSSQPLQAQLDDNNRQLLQVREELVRDENQLRKDTAQIQIAAKSTLEKEAIDSKPVRIIVNAPRLGDMPVAIKSANTAWGKFYALILTVDDSPGNDQMLAASLAHQLRQRYSFSVKQIRNPNGAQVFAAINDFQKSLQSNDNLLVYFSGTSRIVRNDSGGALGYWLASDSTQDRATWIPHDQIAEHLNLLPARRVLLITSGSFYNGLEMAPMPGASRKTISTASLDSLLRRRARIVISGDSTRLGLTRLLTDNDQVIDASTIWSKLASYGRPTEAPMFGQLLPGSDSGQFFLVPEQNAVSSRIASNFPVIASVP